MDAETDVPAPENRLDPLPIRATATGAWRAVLEHRDILALVGALAFLPAALPLAAELLFDGVREFLPILDGWVRLVFTASAYAASAYVASYWHRLLLVGRAEVVATLPRWTRGETRLFGWYVGFAILAWIGSFVAVLPFIVFLDAPDTLPPWFPTLVACVVALLLAYVGVRISMAFPAAAIDGPSHSFLESWRATTGNGWRLVAASALALSPLVLPAWGAYHLFTSHGLRQLFGVALTTLTGLMSVVIPAGVLSLAYHRLVLTPGRSMANGLARLREDRLT